MTAIPNGVLPRIEGDTLYVSPAQYDTLQLTITGHTAHGTTTDAATYDALLKIGLDRDAITARYRRETKVVVDHVGGCEREIYKRWGW